MSNIPLSDLRISSYKRGTTVKKYINELYSALRARSKRMGYSHPNFTKNELMGWLYQNDFEILYENYKTNNYNKSLRPSVDRINDYGKYEFSNMRLITWDENNRKGRKSPKHLTKMDKLKRRLWVWTIYGDLIMENVTYDAAAEYLNTTKLCVINVSRGKRKSIKGHIITHDNIFKIPDMANRRIVSLKKRDDIQQEQN
jgi:hypothetical protein